MRFFSIFKSEDLVFLPEIRLNAKVLQVLKKNIMAKCHRDLMENVFFKLFTKIFLYIVLVTWYLTQDNQKTKKKYILINGRRNLVEKRK